MKIIGISCFYHDSAAAIVVDGRLIAAVSEERFSGIKNDADLPTQAVKFCLKKANCSIDDIDYIVFYDKPLTKFDRILTGYMASPFVSLKPLLAALPSWLKKKLWVGNLFASELGFKNDTLYLPHHLSHAAGSFYSSPFDKAALLTIDGVGEWATATIGIGRGPKVKLLTQMNYPHSVGLLYSAFTHYLGFRVNSAEYKVMGLAAYGEPKFANLIRDELVKIHDDGSIHLNLKNFSFHKSLTMTDDSFEKLFGQPRRAAESELTDFHHNVAASIQQVTEEIILKMAKQAKKLTGQKNLCLAGGVALNCQANGKLLRENIFDKIYVQPAAGDAGGAVGAALYAWHKITGTPKESQPFFHIGPSSTDDELERFLKKHEIPRTEYRPEQLAATLAAAIEQGKIIALYQGSAEFGPRALGFRSIIADPRDLNMKERINKAIKFRETFRPFAPAVLAEKAELYFENAVESPYMCFNFQVREEIRSMIPAVTHEDNSSRIQTVAEADNPFFYKIIDEFYQLTNLPIVLNTSFNLRGHPIVNSPEQALATFCSGGIDILAIGNYLLERENLSSQTIARFSVGMVPD